MRIAITGATGFLGQDLTAKLLAVGHELVCTRHHHPCHGAGEPSLRIEWVTGCFSNKAVCDRLVEGCDVLVHAARHGARGARGESAISYLEHNVLGGLRLFDAARIAGVRRILYVSTTGVRGVSMDEAFMSQNAIGLYPLMKATMEMLANHLNHRGDVEICSLRPSAIFGLAPDRSSVPMYNWARQIVQGKPLTLQTSHREWVHVEDVSRAIMFLLDQPEIGGRHLDCFDPSLPSDYEITKMIARIAGVAATDCKDQIHLSTRRYPEALLQLGFEFGGIRKLEETLQQFVDEV